MNPFDEQEQKILLDASLLQAEIKLKKLYTWYDIDAVREECENKIDELHGKYADEYDKLPEYEENWGWIFASGIGIGFIVATIILTIIHNL